MAGFWTPTYLDAYLNIVAKIPEVYLVIGGSGSQEKQFVSMPLSQKQVSPYRVNQRESNFYNFYVVLKY